MIELIDQEEVFYEDTFKGKKVFLLIHNAGGSHRFFEPQLPILRRLGRVIAVTLPGHGRSKAVKTASIANYADTIIRFCENLGIQNIHGVGLNYGANIFLEIVSKTSLVKSLFLIDPPVNISKTTEKLIAENIDYLLKVDRNEYASKVVSESFTNPQKKYTKLSRDAFKAVELSILSQIYKDLLLWDKAHPDIFEKISFDCIVVLTDGALCGGESIKRVNPSIKIERVKDSLYWATLDAPEKISKLLVQFFS